MHPDAALQCAGVTDTLEGYLHVPLTSRYIFRVDGMDGTPATKNYDYEASHGFCRHASLPLQFDVEKFTYLPTPRRGWRLMSCILAITREV